MANHFNVNDPVRQVVPVIQGTVKEKMFVGDDICYRVEFDESGETHNRVFKESELEAV